MADYTLRNFKDIPDTAGEHAPSLESRFGRKHLDSKHLGVSYFRYESGFRLDTGHTHREQEEVYVVLAGSGRLKLDDEIVSVGRLDVIRVAPGVFRGFEAGPEGLEIVAVGSDRPEGGDSAHTPDFWGGAPRAGSA
jgi:mannose-6-phosphate isomerase-like protein (cupin superfamily)